MKSAREENETKRRIDLEMHLQENKAKKERIKWEEAKIRESLEKFKKAREIINKGQADNKIGRERKDK